MDSRNNRDDHFTHPNHLLDHHLKRPLPVNGHNGHLKMPESPHSAMQMLYSGLAMPPSPSTPSSSIGTPSGSHSHSSNTPSSDQQSSAHIIEEYLQAQITRWRSNNLEMTDLIGELLTVMPPEDQMQFMTGIMELIYKKRNNPEEEKQMRKYFLGGNSGAAS